MRINIKAKAVLGIAVLGTIIGVGSIAVAAFVQTSAVDSVTGSTETFAPATVTGAQTGTLLPGESALVTLTLTNPNSNVKARLLSVAPGEVFIDKVKDPADAVYCRGQIVLSVAGANPLMPTLAVSEANFPFAVKDAVMMLANTDIRCQGMTFHTTWSTQFEAVR